jgi:hypothetical protein
MSSDTNEPPQHTDKDLKLERAKFLWDEYRYRHELCWKLIFQITTAVVIILIIPYIKVDIAKSIGKAIVSLPILAIALSGFSISRLSRELDILDKIRSKHREHHKNLFHIKYKGGSNFSRDVKLYLWGLALISVVDIVAIVCVWLPTLK